jgi:hypothetical protein
MATHPHRDSNHPLLATTVAEKKAANTSERLLPTYRALTPQMPELSTIGAKRGIPSATISGGYSWVSRWSPPAEVREMKGRGQASGS